MFTLYADDIFIFIELIIFHCVTSLCHTYAYDIGIHYDAEFFAWLGWCRLMPCRLIDIIFPHASPSHDDDEMMLFRCHWWFAFLFRYWWLASRFCDIADALLLRVDAAEMPMPTVADIIAIFAADIFAAMMTLFSPRRLTLRFRYSAGFRWWWYYIDTRDATLEAAYIWLWDILYFFRQFAWLRRRQFAICYDEYFLLSSFCRRIIY